MTRKLITTTIAALVASTALAAPALADHDRDRYDDRYDDRYRDREDDRYHDDRDTESQYGPYHDEAHDRAYDRRYTERGYYVDRYNDRNGYYAQLIDRERADGRRGQAHFGVRLRGGADLQLVASDPAIRIRRVAITDQWGRTTLLRPRGRTPVVDLHNLRGGRFQIEVTYVNRGGYGGEIALVARR